MAKKLSTTKNPDKKSITGGLTGSELTQANKALKIHIEELKDQAPEWWNPETIITRSPFMDLFPIKIETLNDIFQSMTAKGFDINQPLIMGVFPEGYALIDGHTRRQASIKSGIESVPVVKMDFANDQEALDYAIHLQKDRRNITDSELYAYIHAIDKTETRGRKKGSSEPNLNKGSSAHRTAELTGTSATKVKKARAIEKEGSDELKEEVRTGQKTINSAYNEVKYKGKDEGVSDEYKQLPKISISGEMILYLVKQYEVLIDTEEHKFEYHCGKFMALYDLVLNIHPMEKLMQGKLSPIGAPLLAAHYRVKKKIDSKIDKNTIADITVSLKK